MRQVNHKKIVYLVLAIVLLVSLCLVFSRAAQYMIYPQKYQEYVTEYSREFGVPEYLVYSVIKVESGYDSDAVSQKGACGLMQLMPETYRWLVETLEEIPKDIFDAQENIKYGTYYLSMLYERYGDWKLALCAYNAGMGNVDKWLGQKEFKIQFPETQNYVNKLDVVMEKYKFLYYGKRR